MTDQLPDPEEQRRLLASIPSDMGTALRLVSSFVDGDGPGATAVIAEIAGAGPEGMNVTGALAMLASRLAHGLTQLNGRDPQSWLHAAVLGVYDDVERRLNGGGDEL